MGINPLAVQVTELFNDDDLRTHASFPYYTLPVVKELLWVVLMCTQVWHKLVIRNDFLNVICDTGMT
jgi:hypothetical protein